MAGSCLGAEGLEERSQSMLAAELLRLGQGNLIQSKAAAAPDDAIGAMWVATDVSRRLTSEPGTDREALVKRYEGAVRQYLEKPGERIDGRWGWSEAQWVRSALYGPTLREVELWGGLEADRKELARWGEVAGLLLQAAKASLTSEMAASEKHVPFDEAAYTVLYQASQGVEYAGIEAAYVRALGRGKADPLRERVLTWVFQQADRWTTNDDAGMAGVALSLKGKALLALGDQAAAVKVFEQIRAASGNEASIDARAMEAVAWLKQGDAAKAAAESAALLADVAKAPGTAEGQRVAIELLAFRIEWQAAGKDGALRQRLASLMESLLQQRPAYAAWIYRAIAAQAEGSEEQLPLAILAMAEQVPEGAGDLPGKLQGAEKAWDANGASDFVRQTAALLAIRCATAMNNHAAVAEWCVRFAAAFPKDSRSAGLVEKAFVEIEAGKKSDSPEQRKVAAEMEGQALSVATGVLNEARFRFAMASRLEAEGKTGEAMAMYARVPTEDAEGAIAAYRRVRLANAAFVQQQQGNDAAAIQQAGISFIEACEALTGVAAKPSKQTSAETVVAIRGAMVDVWLAEASAASDVRVAKPREASMVLKRVEELKTPLLQEQQTRLFELRFAAYAARHDPTGAIAAMDRITMDAQNGIDQAGRAIGALWTECQSLEKSKAGSGVELGQFLKPVLERYVAISRKAGATPERAVALLRVEGDVGLMVRDYEQVLATGHAIEQLAADDVSATVLIARGTWGLGGEAKVAAEGRTRYSDAENAYAKVLAQATPSSELFWECWVRILEAKELLSGPAVKAEIQKRLSDLHNAYGDKAGGVQFGEEFRGMMKRFGV